MRRHQVLLISGSLRSGSTNTALLRTAQRVAPDEIETVLYEGLDALPHFNPDRDHPPLPAQVAALRAAIHDADAILICTPEYAAALPGSFKNLLDWTIGDDQPRSIYNKPTAWINVSSNQTQATDAHDSLRKVLDRAHAAVVSDACTTIPVARQMIDKDGLIGSHEIRSAVAEALATLTTPTGPHG